VDGDSSGTFGPVTAPEAGEYIVPDGARGTTLRGLLLNAYAFWQIGQIAMWAAIAAFIGAFIFLCLSLLGFLHMRRTPREAQFDPTGTRPRAPAAH
jgi:hypothetical protein